MGIVLAPTALAFGYAKTQELKARFAIVYDPRFRLIKFKLPLCQPDFEPSEHFQPLSRVAADHEVIREADHLGLELLASVDRLIQTIKVEVG